MGVRVVEKGATILVADAQKAIRVKTSCRRRDPPVDWNTRPTDKPVVGVFGQMVKKVADRPQANTLADG
jgi:hypothetical protein